MERGTESWLSDKFCPKRHLLQDISRRRHSIPHKQPQGRTCADTSELLQRHFLLQYRKVCQRRGTPCNGKENKNCYAYTTHTAAGANKPLFPQRHPQPQFVGHGNHAKLRRHILRLYADAGKIPPRIFKRA